MKGPKQNNSGEENIEEIRAQKAEVPVNHMEGIDADEIDALWFRRCFPYTELLPDMDTPDIPLHKSLSAYIHTSHPPDHGMMENVKWLIQKRAFSS